jgi:hypothetical protein
MVVSAGRRKGKANSLSDKKVRFLSLKEKDLLQLNGLVQKVSIF